VTLNCVVTSVAGCASAGGQNTSVTINPGPTADAGTNRTLCADSPVVIGGSPTASGGTGPYTYSWSPATGLSDATNANPTATVTDTTTYTVTVTDHNGCTANASVVLTVIPQPNIQSITMSGTNVTLVWSSLTNQTYRVEYKTVLTDATWTPLTPDVTATNATTTFTNSFGAATQRFYHVFLLCP
jgi:hypothetical protein